MAIQNDNTLVTKGDLKSLYTDKIAPYLGGGISYYYTNRTGEELRCSEYTVTASLPVGNPINVKGTLVNRVIDNIQKRSDFVINDNTIIIPEGVTVRLCSCFYFSGSGKPDVNYRFYDYQNDISIDTGYSAYSDTDGYSIAGSWTSIYTAPTGGAKIGVKFTKCNSTMSVTDSSRIIVEEINRIVDPIKYVSNNSDLEETPVGNIISYMGNNVPKHYLACDGQTYPIGSYPELEAFIINEFGSINYFGGDGSTTWAVPDLRGEFLRGTGTNSHSGQGNGENVGVHQNGTVVFGMYKDNDTLQICADNGSYMSGSGQADAITTTSTPWLVLNKSRTSGSEARSGKARPTNTSVQYCIKYESTFHAFFSNAAYKVSVKASIAASTNSAVMAIFDSSDIIGDSSLVSGNYLVAPMDGMYSIGCNWTCHGSFDQDYYFEINGVGLSASKQIGLSNTLYLSKGDKVDIIKYNGAANEGRINFCLLTSNYNPTIVSADSVYSENEQMIGYWKDGKPIYQKTINFGNMPDATNKLISHGISNIDQITYINGYATNGTYYVPMPYANGSLQEEVRNPSVAVRTTKTELEIITKNNWSAYNAFITVQYTKTTDTASTLQIENSLLLNRPDLWEVNKEYSFGGGLCGIRKTGTITLSTLGTRAEATILSGLTKRPKLVSQGGDVFHVSGGWSLPNPWSFNEKYDAPRLEYCIYCGAQNNLIFYIVGNEASSLTSYEYDIWVTYKK